MLIIDHMLKDASNSLRVAVETNEAQNWACVW